ncbi:MAG: MarR family transcriptional regulator [Chloroflexota bacterium]|nr:MarR family transcriptional regulator [Chloroflexota bacterium]
MSREGSRRSELLEAVDREIRQVSAASVLFSQAVAARLGINSTDLECLDFLFQDGPVTAGGLAELTGLTTAAITGVIDRLEDAGYVRRERDPHDRRRVYVRPILERTEREIAPLFEGMGQAMAEVYSAYSDEELDLIRDFVRRANRATSGEAARLRAGTVPTGSLEHQTAADAGTGGDVPDR